MSRVAIPSLRRLWRYHPFLVVAIALLAATAGVGAVGGTLAVFTAQTQNATGTFAAGWIGPATNLSLTPSGYDASLLWTPGSHGSVTGQELWGYDNGSASSCPSSGYTDLGALASATTSTYTKTNTSSVNGHYYCYEIQSTSSTDWTGTGSFPATQLGLVATGVSLANGLGTSGQIDANDVVTLTFNQDTTYPTTSQTITVCAFTSGVVLIGDTGCAAPTDTPTIGKLTLGSGTIGANGSWATTKAKASATAPWTITVTLAGAATSAITGQGSWTFTPSTSIVSQNGGADQAAACTSPTYNCTPTSSGGGF